MSYGFGLESRAKKAVAIVVGLLLAVAVMIVTGVAEGTPEPVSPPSVAPRPSKW
jgi:hypothetical protein